MDAHSSSNMLNTAVQHASAVMGERDAHSSEGLSATKSAAVTSIDTRFVWSDFDSMLRGKDAKQLRAQQLVGEMGFRGPAQAPAQLEPLTNWTQPLIVDSPDVADDQRTDSLALQACIPLCGKCSYLAPAFVDLGDFATHAALSELFGPQTVEVWKLNFASLHTCMVWTMFNPSLTFTMLYAGRSNDQRTPRRS